MMLNFVAHFHPSIHEQITKNCHFRRYLLGRWVFIGPSHAIFGQYLVPDINQTEFQSAVLGVRAGLEPALCAHGRSGWFGLEPNWFWKGSRSQSLNFLCHPIGVECVLVHPFLWAEESVFGFNWNRFALADDLRNVLQVQEHRQNRGLFVYSVFTLGEFRDHFEREYLVVEPIIKRKNLKYFPPQ